MNFPRSRGVGGASWERRLPDGSIGRVSDGVGIRGQSGDSEEIP